MPTPTQLEVYQEGITLILIQSKNGKSRLPSILKGAATPSSAPKKHCCKVMKCMFVSGLFFLLIQPGKESRGSLVVLLARAACFKHSFILLFTLNLNSAQYQVSVGIKHMLESYCFFMRIHVCTRLSQLLPAAQSVSERGW